jgi:hypothetical protein
MNYEFQECLRAAGAHGLISTRAIPEPGPRPDSGSNTRKNGLSPGFELAYVKPDKLSWLFRRPSLSHPICSMLTSMYCDRRSCVTITSFVTKISVHAATTEGQKMGIEAHIIAKSHSRHEKMRTSGNHHVKSNMVGVLLYLSPLAKRRTAIRITLYGSAECNEH